MTFYIFAPALLFSLLVESEMEAGELARLSAFSAAAILGMGVVGFGFGRMLNLNRKQTIILMLAAMFGNVGNMGLPLNQLRYGEAGLARAAPYFVMSGMLVYTVGVIITSLGTQPWRKAIVGLTRLPILYALITGLLITVTGYQLPAPILDSVRIAGQGSIPVMLIVLGMQIADVKQIDEIRVALPAVALRLLVAPLVAVGLLTLFQIDGLNYSVSLLQSSTPVAVATIIITTEYDVLPKAMTTTVVLSTLLSPLTLVALIQIFSL